MYNKGGEYRKNLFGDITAIYQGATKLAEYVYDAWGNCSIAASTTDYAIAHANPIRYRGYYFDQESGWYFLNARYYSPEWRRFISPDDIPYLAPKNVNGCNLYCYCRNNPVDYMDQSGYEPLSIIILMTLEYLVPVLLLSFVGAIAVSMVYNTKKTKDKNTENNITDNLPPTNDKIIKNDDKPIFEGTKKNTNTFTEQDLVFFTQGFHWLVSHMNFHGGPGFNVTVNMFDTDYFSWLDFK